MNANTSIGKLNFNLKEMQDQLNILFRSSKEMMELMRPVVERGTGRWVQESVKELLKAMKLLIVAGKALNLNSKSVNEFIKNVKDVDIIRYLNQPDRLSPHDVIGSFWEKVNSYSSSNSRIKISDTFKFPEVVFSEETEPFMINLIYEIMVEILNIMSNSFSSFMKWTTRDIDADRDGDIVVPIEISEIEREADVTYQRVKSATLSPFKSLIPNTKSNKSTEYRVNLVSGFLFATKPEKDVIHYGVFKSINNLEDTLGIPYNISAIIQVISTNRDKILEDSTILDDLFRTLGAFRYIDRKFDGELKTQFEGYSDHTAMSLETMLRNREYYVARLAKTNSIRDSNNTIYNLLDKLFLESCEALAELPLFYNEKSIEVLKKIIKLDKDNFNVFSSL